MYAVAQIDIRLCPVGGFGLDPKDEEPPLDDDKGRKADAHGQNGGRNADGDEHDRDRDADAQLRLTRHAAVLHETLKVVLVRAGRAEPAVEALRAFGEARSRQKQERRRGHDVQHNADGAQRCAKEPERDE